MQNSLARNDEAGNAHDDRRRHRRKPVIWSARIETGFGAVECVILDLSLGGAMLRITGKAALRQKLKLVIDRFGALDAEVIWSRSQRMGLRFTQSPETVARIIGGALPLAAD